MLERERAWGPASLGKNKPDESADGAETNPTEGEANSRHTTAPATLDQPAGVSEVADVGRMDATTAIRRAGSALPPLNLCKTVARVEGRPSGAPIAKAGVIVDVPTPA